jgi:cathepsin A (carboxypeptidase C)
MSKLTLIGALAALSCVLINAAPTADQVTSLPGINFQPNFIHYSGYLKASSTHQLHYWFVRHQYATSTSPVLLWLNGGPGCSSLGGLIEENGPFHIKDNGNTVFENVYAWNKVGHVIYLESPAGVGFSYSTNGDITTDDDKTATENYNALVDFFTNKFPELKSNDFYITGESYGGVYIPTLAVLVANDKTNFPGFKGVAIGNGILHDQFNWNTQPALFFYHAIMRQGLYDQVAKQCCNGNPYTCDYANLGGACGDLVDVMLNQADDQDPYNLYAVCYLDGGSTKKTLIRDFLFRRKDKDGKIRRRNRQLGAALPLCAQESNTATYLNRQDVRTALHIPSTVGTWSDCNDLLNEFFYTRIYDDMSTQVKTLVQKGIRVLIYNGDVDSVCNVIMNGKFLFLYKFKKIDFRRICQPTWLDHSRRRCEQPPSLALQWQS